MYFSKSWTFPLRLLYFYIFLIVKQISTHNKKPIQICWRLNLYCLYHNILEMLQIKKIMRVFNETWENLPAGRRLVGETWKKSKSVAQVAFLLCYVSCIWSVCMCDCLCFHKGQSGAMSASVMRTSGETPVLSCQALNNSYCAAVKFFCAWACDWPWLYPHSPCRQRLIFNAFLRNTSHRPPCVNFTH